MINKSGFKFHLKNKPFALELVFVALISSIKLFVILFFLPDELTIYAVDESGYLENVRALVEQVKSYDISLTSLPNSSLAFGTQSTLIPATLFSLLGINELLSIRLTSWLYATLSLLVLINLISLRNGKEFANIYVFRFSQTLFNIAYLAIVSLTPSSFLWSVLGLRETAVIFGTILCANGTYRIAREKSQSSKWTSYQIGFMLVFVSLIILSTSREIMASAVFFVLIIPTIIYTFRKYSLFPLVIAALFLIISMTLAHSYANNDSQENQKNRVSMAIRDVAKTKDYFTVESIRQSQNKRSENANLSIWNEDCFKINFENVNAAFNATECFVKNIARGLLGPSPFEKNLSRIASMAAFENLWWLALYLTFFCSLTSLLLKRKLDFFMFQLAFFVIAYYLILIALSGSIGSIHRHKATVLWMIVFVCHRALANTNSFSTKNVNESERTRKKELH